MKTACGAKSGPANHFWRGGKVEVECNNCHSKLKRFRCLVRERNFCNRKCHSEFRMTSASGDNNPNFKGGSERKCETCGKVVWRCPSRKTDLVYCSLECFKKGEFGTRKSKRWSPGSKWGGQNSKKGKREDLGMYFRSSWEANYARYLNWLKSLGKISSWSYESKTFEFQGIRRGVRFYTPDFEVVLPDQSVEYHEVKGWQHPKGQTALKRMKKYHPSVKITLIDAASYKSIAGSVSKLIPNWE